MWLGHEMRHIVFSTAFHETAFFHPAYLVKRIQSQASEASTYEARASQFSFSIFYLIVKDLIWCKKSKRWKSETKGGGGADVGR